MAAAPPLRHSADAAQRIALALGAFALAFGLSAWRMGHGAPDFYVFWTAAQHWRTPYDPAIIAALEARIHLGGVWPFAYPPTFLLFAWPFAQLPLGVAYPLWAGVEAGGFFLAASLIVRPVWAAAALALAPIVFFAALLGQTSLITGAAMLAAWNWREARPVLAGLLLGAAACIKPQAVIAAPLVFWGRWRLLAAMLAAGAALTLGSVLAFGWQRWLEWPRALASFSQLVPATDRINPSALTPGPWWALLVGGLGVWIALVRRDLGGLVAGALCLAPYAHAYDLAPLAPVALGWLLGWRNSGWPHAIVGGALLAGLIATPLAALALCLALAVLPAPGAAPSSLHRLGPPFARLRAIWRRGRAGDVSDPETPPAARGAS